VHDRCPRPDSRGRIFRLLRVRTLLLVDDEPGILNTGARQGRRKHALSSSMVYATIASRAAWERNNPRTRN